MLPNLLQEEEPIGGLGSIDQKEKLVSPQIYTPYNLRFVSDPSLYSELKFIFTGIRNTEKQKVLVKKDSEETELHIDSQLTYRGRKKRKSYPFDHSRVVTGKGLRVDGSVDVNFTHGFDTTNAARGNIVLKGDNTHEGSPTLRVHKGKISGEVTVANGSSATLNRCNVYKDLTITQHAGVEVNAGYLEGCAVVDFQSQLNSTEFEIYGGLVANDGSRVTLSSARVGNDHSVFGLIATNRSEVVLNNADLSESIDITHSSCVTLHNGLISSSDPHPINDRHNVTLGMEDNRANSYPSMLILDNTQIQIPIIVGLNGTLVLYENMFSGSVDRLTRPLEFHQGTLVIQRDDGSEVKLENITQQFSDGKELKGYVDQNVQAKALTELPEHKPIHEEEKTIKQFLQNVENEKNEGNSDDPIRVLMVQEIESPLDAYIADQQINRLRYLEDLAHKIHTHTLTLDDVNGFRTFVEREAIQIAKSKQWSPKDAEERFSSASLRYCNKELRRLEALREINEKYPLDKQREIIAEIDGLDYREEIPISDPRLNIYLPGIYAIRPHYRINPHQKMFLGELQEMRRYCLAVAEYYGRNPDYTTRSLYTSELSLLGMTPSLTTVHSGNAYDYKTPLELISKGFTTSSRRLATLPDGELYAATRKFLSAYAGEEFFVSPPDPRLTKSISGAMADIPDYKYYFAYLSERGGPLFRDNPHFFKRDYTVGDSCVLMNMMFEYMRVLPESRDAIGKGLGEAQKIQQGRDAELVKAIYKNFGISDAVLVGRITFGESGASIFIVDVNGRREVVKRYQNEKLEARGEYAGTDGYEYNLYRRFQHESDQAELEEIGAVEIYGIDGPNVRMECLPLEGEYKNRYVSLFGLQDGLYFDGNTHIEEKDRNKDIPVNLTALRCLQRLARAHDAAYKYGITFGIDVKMDTFYFYVDGTGNPVPEKLKVLDWGDDNRTQDFKNDLSPFLNNIRYILPPKLQETFIRYIGLYKRDHQPIDDRQRQQIDDLPEGLKRVLFRLYHSARLTYVSGINQMEPGQFGSDYKDQIAEATAYQSWTEIVRDINEAIAEFHN